MDDLFRLRAGVFALAQDLDAIDKHIAHAGRILMRSFKRRMVLNAGGIEDHDIGEAARLEGAAAVELEVFGGQRASIVLWPPPAESASHRGHTCPAAGRRCHTHAGGRWVSGRPLPEPAKLRLKTAMSPATAGPPLPS